MAITRDDRERQDAADPLAGLRDEFELPPGVIGDFRAPDLIRSEITPRYRRDVDLWTAAAMREVIETGAWPAPRNTRAVGP